MRSSRLGLSDGRTLAFLDLGDPDGSPVMAIHGSPDSSQVWRLVDDGARRRGVRVVAPDRPGFGDSTPRPGRRVVDWVDDADALADELGWGRFRVIAVSGGSPYATAMAHARPDRIDHLGLLACICPLGVPGAGKGANPQIRFTFEVARRFPLLLGPMARLMVRLTTRDIDAAAARLTRTRPPADRAIIERPEVQEVLYANLPAQFRDAETVALEFRNAAAPWGFDLSRIEVPTTIWQGGLDDVHPPAMGEYLRDHIPGARYVFEPDYATFNWFDDLDRVFDDLLV